MPNLKSIKQKKQKETVSMQRDPQEDKTPLKKNIFLMLKSRLMLKIRLNACDGVIFKLFVHTNISSLSSTNRKRMS